MRKLHPINSNNIVFKNISCRFSIGITSLLGHLYIKQPCAHTQRHTHAHTQTHRVLVDVISDAMEAQSQSTQQISDSLNSYASIKALCDRRLLSPGLGKLRQQ